MSLQKVRIVYWPTPAATFDPPAYAGDERFKSAMRPKLTTIEGYINNQAGGVSGTFTDPEHGVIDNVPEYLVVTTDIPAGRDVYKPGAPGIPEVGQEATRAVTIFASQVVSTVNI